MAEGNSQLFEAESVLPSERLTKQAAMLIGFKARYERIHDNLRLLIDKDGLEAWSNKHYGKRLPILDSLQERYPLVIFHGDVGTGKTASAEALANALTKELNREAMLFKLSTRVRGSGNVGEMSTLINQAFEIVSKEAGKTKLSFLIIDEADSLAASRSGNQSHHEDKVAVNTLIQKIDDVRRFAGRVLIILCTNRYGALDPAILRRAAYVEQFDRPSDSERRELLELDCRGLELSDSSLDDLVRLTGTNGPHRVVYTFSDIRTRLIPEAIAQAYPNRKILEEDFSNAILKVKPSSAIVGGNS